MNLPGLCMFQNLSIYNEIKSCIPGPACTPDTLLFTLHFWRNPSLGGGGCSPSCIESTDSSFSISVVGYQDTAQSLAAFQLYADTPNVHQYKAINLSSGKQPLSYVWSWGDGTFDYVAYPSHTYANAGFYNICLTVTDANGCSTTYCDSSFYIQRTTNTMITVDVVPPAPLAIEKVNSPDYHFNIYPNPASGDLTIHTSVNNGQESEISIINMLGEVMQKEKIKINKEEKINIKELPSGMYMIRVAGQEEEWVGRFVKQ